LRCVIISQCGIQEPDVNSWNCYWTTNYMG